MNIKRARPVEVLNADGTTTVYPSIHNTVKALKKSSSSDIYRMVGSGTARLLRQPSKFLTMMG